MDNYEKIKFKDAGGGWYVKIFLDEADNETSRTPSFKNGKGSGTGLYKEMQAWVDAGNEIESEYTQEELLQKEKNYENDLLLNLKSERNNRLLQADKWELPTILSRFDITIEQVLEYKLDLLDMDKTHTTVEQLENPKWPEKLILQKLL